jgi:cytoskeletal protein CcmA (bactofilin family)
MADNINTIIGKSAAIEGKIEVQGHLRVDGLIKGTVNCDESVTIGPDGKIEGDLETKTAIIIGTVTGNVNAQERIELQSKSVVNGDIQTKSLIVEQGAVFHGACKMKDNYPAKPADKTTK